MFQDKLTMFQDVKRRSNSCGNCLFPFFLFSNAFLTVCAHMPFRPSFSLAFFWLKSQQNNHFQNAPIKENAVLGHCKSVVTDFGGSNPPSPTKCYGLKRSTPENPCTARVFAVFRANFCSAFSVIHLTGFVDPNHRSNRFRAEIERNSS